MILHLIISAKSLLPCKVTYFLFFIAIELIFSVIFVAGIQQSDSIIYVNIYMYVCAYALVHILFHYGLLQDSEYSFLCYTVGLCWLSVKYTIACMCQSQSPNLSLSPLVTISLFSRSVSFCFVNSFVSFFSMNIGVSLLVG